jgi:hypothetical protein
MASKKPSKPAVSTQDRLTEVVYIIRGIDAHKQQIVDTANAQLKELEDVKVQYVEKAKVLQAQLEEEQKAKEAPKETKETKEDK